MNRYHQIRQFAVLFCWLVLAVIQQSPLKLTIGISWVIYISSLNIFVLFNFDNKRKDSEMLDGDSSAHVT